ncbi:MAG TPA: hypothetical protein VNT79_06815 [Phycisphaerae bacterium]|nr:hypothetical protein [Phycisphaerae bacterium]
MTRRRTVALLPAHPKQLWMLHAVAGALKKTADAVWVLRDKDCTIDLAKQLGLEYIIISRAATGLAGNAAELSANVFRALQLTLRRRIDMWVTKYGAANIAARLLGRRSISFNDDDADVVPLIAWTSYPFSDAIIVPHVTRMGRWEKKALRYPGHQELFYLHPSRFTPDPSIRRELGIEPGMPFAILRLTSLQSHHDVRASGMNEALVRDVIRLAEAQTPAIRVLISSEKPLTPEFEPRRFPLPASRIHHALAMAEFFVGDSQSMTTEAAILGTPAFRINTFVQQIAAMEVMEHCGLAFGFVPGDEFVLLEALRETLGMADRRAVFAQRRSAMLRTMADPLPLFVGVIERRLEGVPLVDIRQWFAQQVRAQQSSQSIT